MAEIALERLTKVYPDGTKAVIDLDLEVGAGEFVVFVGPSGCGKTTALRMVAGLETITSGNVRIDGQVVNDLPPKNRDIAMVFQNYALYPHMTVRDNMGFALKLAKVDQAEIDRKVDEASSILELNQHLDRKPANLSGGQRQRVAMGRAIVREPAAFLMDEPLSNLDAKLRVQTRGQILKLQKRLGTTTVYVTHDQVEAMTMGDRIAVMSGGVVKQLGTPKEVYESPQNVFVASFVGSPAMNLVRCRLDPGDRATTIELCGAQISLTPSVFARHPRLREHLGGSVIVGIRPEDLADAALLPAANGSCLDVDVALAEPLGAELIAHFPLSGNSSGRGPSPDLHETAGTTLTARLSPLSTARAGRRLRLAVNVDRLHFFDEATGQQI
jgi:multiple sugar transport system ATP-binding protein